MKFITLVLKLNQLKELKNKIKMLVFFLIKYKIGKFSFTINDENKTKSYVQSLKQNILLQLFVMFSL